MQYLVRGYSKTGVYAEIIESDDMEEAFKIGKKKINDIPPLSPIKSWRIDREQ